MAQHRSPRSIRRLDRSKYAVLLVGALIVIGLLLTKSYQPPATPPPEPNATRIAVFTAEATLARPVLISPMTGATMAPGAITLTGEAARGHSVRVRSGTALLASVPVDAQGQWSATVHIDKPGAHTIVLEQVNAAGVVVASSESLAVRIGVPAQTAVSPALDSNMTTRDLSAGPLRLSGIGEPNSTLQIVVDDAVLTETTVDATGKWAVTLRVNTPGIYAVALRSLDANREVVATATPTILQIAPAAHSVQAILPTDTPAAVAALTTINAVIVNTEPDANRIAASGMGMPGVEVQLILDGAAVSTATIGETGNWSLVTALEQPDAYAVAVRAIDPATGETVDIPVPAQRMIIALPTPTSTPTASATPEIAVPATVTATLAAPFVVAGYAFDNDSGTVRLEGSGAAAGVVRLLLDRVAVVTGTVDLDGRWVLSTTLGSAGDHALQVEYLAGQDELAGLSPVLAVSVPAMPAAILPPVPVTSSPAAETLTATHTATPIAAPTQTRTATQTPTATNTPTLQPTTIATELAATDAATLSPLPAAIGTSTMTATLALSSAAMPIATHTATPTAVSPTATNTPTPQPTATATVVPARTVGATATELAAAVTLTSSLPVSQSLLPTATGTAPAVGGTTSLRPATPAATATSPATGTATLNQLPAGIGGYFPGGKGNFYGGPHSPSRP